MGSDFPHLLIIITIVVILLFDYTNGFHDASNIIGTVVACGAMSPVRAVLVVGFFEFLGPILGGTAVANTIGAFISIGDLPVELSIPVIFSGLLGAICWNLITWWFGLPSSSSHALVGGLVGAVVVSAGSDHVVWGVDILLQQHRWTGFTKILASLLLSPLIGFAVGFWLHRLMRLLLNPASPAANRSIKKVQLFTAAGLAFSHGANDAQKSMGIITLVLLLGGFIPSFAVPLWVMLLCAMAITLGILSGGWRIVQTIGFGIYKLRPLHALDSQLTATAVILTASLHGAPVSTTHVVSSSIMGIGASEWPKRVKWTMAAEIVATWLITIPTSALMGAVIFLMIRGLLAV